MIESGEIVERRSLVVRSSRTDWNEGPTEVAAPPIIEVPRRRWHVLWLAGAILWSIAATTFAIRARPDRSSVDALYARGEMLATTLDAEARTTQMRAEGLAASPVLRAAIETDAATLADMARDHHPALALRPGETLELYQLSGGQRSLLLRLPADATPLVPPATGQASLESANKRVVVTATAAVSNERSRLAGELVLSSTADLAPVTKRIAEYARGAVLVGMSQPVPLIDSRAAANLSIQIAAKTPGAGSLVLQASLEHAGGSSALAWICMTIAAILLAVYVVSKLRARRA